MALLIFMRINEGKIKLKGRTSYKATSAVAKKAQKRIMYLLDVFVFSPQLYATVYERLRPVTTVYDSLRRSTTAYYRRRLTTNFAMPRTTYDRMKTRL